MGIQLALSTGVFTFGDMNNIINGTTLIIDDSKQVIKSNVPVQVTGSLTVTGSAHIKDSVLIGSSTSSAIWNDVYVPLRIGESGALYSTTSATSNHGILVGQNVQASPTGTKRLLSGTASLYRQQFGKHYWTIAANAASGSAITWIDAMEITTDGELLISQGIKGDPGFKLIAAVATSTSPNILPSSGDTNTGIGYAGSDKLSLIVGGIEGVRIEKTQALFVGSITASSFISASAIAIATTGSFGRIEATSITASTYYGDDLIITGSVAILSQSSAPALIIRGRIDINNDPSELEHSIVIGNSTTGDALTTGDYNLIIGMNAGSGWSSQDRNTAIGTDAGASSTGAGESTYVGSRAGNNSDSSGKDAGVGANSLYESAGYGAAIGYRTLNNATGQYNTAIGYQAGGGSGNNGTSNVYIGANAGNNSGNNSNKL